MDQDGRLLVEISPDAMKALVTFIPPIAGGHALSVADVDNELRVHGVTQGINWELINQVLEKINSGHQVIRDVLVAQGTAPRPAIPASLIFHPSIQSLDPLFLSPEKQAEKDEAYKQQMVAGRVDSHGNIDYRETQGLFIIHEGQVLARKRDAVEGLPGSNIRGEYIPFNTMEYISLAPGLNTELRDGVVFANKNGRFAWNNSSFWVEETLELTEQVGYKTGNIRFPGNLILKAGIKDRFKVWVGGNLGAVAVLDAYEIFCGANLDAKGGIIGRVKGLVRVRGALDARFLEHCDVEALDNIRLELGSMNSQIHTLGSLETSEKGKLVGGFIQARNGIKTFIAGNKSGLKTVLSAGENYVTHRKLEFSREKMQEIHITQQKVEAQLKKSPHPALALQARRLNEEAQKYQGIMIEVLDKIDDHEESVVKVLGTAYPGVVIEICRVSLVLTHEMKDVEFSLDKSSGMIVFKEQQGKKKPEANKPVKKPDSPNE